MKNPSQQASAARAKGFTIVETMVASALLALMVSLIFTSLIQSYAMGAEARYYDNARAVLTSFADQFQKFQCTDSNGNFRPLFDPTKVGGYGMVWPNALDDQAKGTADPDNTYSAAGLRIHLYSDDDAYGIAGELGVDRENTDEDDGKIATVTREIFITTADDDPAYEAGSREGAAGTILVAKFSITFESGFSRQPVEQSIWVSRTIDNN